VSDNKKETSLQELIIALPGKIFTREAVLWFLALVAGAAGMAWGQSQLDTATTAKLDAGIGPLERRMVVVEQRQLNQGTDIHELQLDVRALYKAVMTGQAQPRLEAPAKDGGP